MPTSYHQALFIDRQTLSLLLKRNYHQHRRCKYYQRLSMVLKSLQQLPSFDDVTNSWIVEWKYLVGQLCGGDSGDSADTNDIMSRKRRIQEEG